MLADILSWAFILGGLFFIVVGALGLVRMPELFTRMHATSVSETLGAGLLLLGLMLLSGISLVTLKLIFILALLVFTAPLVTHALAQAALHEKTEPRLSEDRRPARTEALSGKPASGRRP